MAPTHGRRRRICVDAKWLAHVALARRNGDPMAFSKKVETRNFRQLTVRRKRMIEEFMSTFQANQEAFGRYGSDTWINAVISHLCEPRHALLPLDVENWLATEVYFKKFNRIFQYGTDTAEGRKTDNIEGQPAGAVADDVNVEIIDLTEKAEGTTSKTNPASTKEAEAPENIERAEASISPPENNVNLVNTVPNHGFHTYVNGMYNYIVGLIIEGRTDIRNLELEGCFHVLSTAKLLLDNNPTRP